MSIYYPTKRQRAIFALLIVLALTPLYADDNNQGNEGNLGGRHVLLISIDGMHAVDFENCQTLNTCPNLMALGQHGVTYTRTTTSRPSDSFPGLMALVTGGTPKTVGAFYDVAWDRVLAGPTITTGNGLAGTGVGGCNAGHINGTPTEYEEGVEQNQLFLNGGGPGVYASFIDGGVKSIDPNKLERDPFSTHVPCAPVYPWNFIRTNTIYGVIHAAGGYTAWSDKHAVYTAVSGPTSTINPSTGNPGNLDDYYSPEVNSNQVALPNVTPAGTNFDCGTITPTGNPGMHIAGADWTTNFQAIQCYDQLKVNAVVNWINGKTHLGGSKAPVPVIFGMNFQAVSIGQKLIQGGTIYGGYTDAAGTPTTYLTSEIEFVDAAIGQMVTALGNQHLLGSTTIIITAKHGQSPIDPARFVGIPGSGGTGGTSPANILNMNTPKYVPDIELSGPGPTEDDISQLWLSPGNNVISPVNLAATAAAVAVLEANATTAGIGEVFYGPSLQTLFNSPGVPNNPGPCCNLLPGGDPRTPDIIVAPNIGVIYTTSSTKQEEHGGFAFDDTNVMLLVSNPDIQAKTIVSWVETKQVAPTILQILGLNPNSLDAVKSEGTAVLPGLSF